MAGTPNIAQNVVVKEVVDDGVSIEAVSTEVLAANALRTNAEFVNISDEIIYLARGATAVMEKGTPVYPNGGSYTIGRWNLYRGIVTGICASGTKNMCVSEGI